MKNVRGVYVRIIGMQEQLSTIVVGFCILVSGRFQLNTKRLGQAASMVVQWYLNQEHVCVHSTQSCTQVDCGHEISFQLKAVTSRKTTSTECLSPCSAVTTARSTGGMLRCRQCQQVPQPAEHSATNYAAPSYRRRALSIANTPETPPRP